MTKKITLWTIQTFSFYEKLKRDSQIHITHSEYLDPEELDGYDWMITHCDYLARKTSDGYDWMRDAMKTRIGEPSVQHCMPIWAWYQWQSQTKKKPDLRYSGHLEAGTHAVRLEIIKDIDDVVLSDFILWHTPYCYKNYIPYNQNDELKMESLINSLHLQDTDFFDYPDHLKSIIRKSWDHIFDLNFPNLEYTDPLAQKSIQATFWSLHMEEVVKVQEFIAR